MKMSKAELLRYGASRAPIATYSKCGPFGIEILDEIELPWEGDFRPCIVWRWPNKKDEPRVSCIRDMFGDDAGFRVNRRWVRLSECAWTNR
jgi:hypothetical protein